MDYKFSIITPEHSEENIPFLVELYESILSQTYSNWEWVILLNGNIKPSAIPTKILEDTRVVISEDRTGNPNLGYIKNKAFAAATGDILVEVDHDDLLVDTCLEKLNIKFQNPAVGFVYSDAAILDTQNKFIPHNPDYGWTHRTVKWQDKELVAMNSFTPSSQSFSFIWFAPDHVRAWRSSVYHSVGGYNPELWVCEDHELMIKTYLVTTVEFIPEVLYVYRITGKNTSINSRNAEIQVKTVELFNQYAIKLAERDCYLKNLLKIDLGGGINPVPGYISIDAENANIIHDLNKGIPLPDNSVGLLNASHIIEHLNDPVFTMSEIHRVLAHGGWAFIEVPSTDGRGAFQDPTHKTFWNQNSFLYYTDAYLAKFIRNKTIRFQSYRCETYFPNDWLKNLGVSVVSAWLVAVKDGPRLPNLLKI